MKFSNCLVLITTCRDAEDGCISHALLRKTQINHRFQCSGKLVLLFFCKFKCCFCVYGIMWRQDCDNKVNIFSLHLVTHSNNTHG